MEPIVRPYVEGDRQTQPTIIYQPGPNGELIPMIVQPASPPENPQVNPQPQPMQAPVAAPSQAPIPTPQAPMAPQGMPSVQGALPQPPQMGQIQGGGQNPFGGGLPPEIEAAMNAGPPKSPEEAASRKGAWTSFVSGVQANPQHMAVLLRFGTNLMQPTPAGQTDVGHLGMALQDSQNYLSALRAQELKGQETRADIDFKKAQTTTEGVKPAAIEAETGRTKAQTQAINEERPQMVLKLKQEIENLKASKSVDEQRARILTADADKEPQKVMEEIELLKAHSWYYKNPGASAKAHESARVQSIESLAKAFVGGGDPELTTLYKTDPVTALNQARVKASAGQVGSYWTSQQEQQQADEIYQMYSDMYDRLSAAGSKQVKGQTREEFIIQTLMLSSIPPSVNSKVMARMGKQGKTTTPKPGERPPLSSFEK